MQKTCFKCRRLLSLAQFYRHSRMADGHLNKCKECTRCDTMQNRRKKTEYYRKYDRHRSALPHRVAARQDRLRQHNCREPEKYRARTMAGNALRDGRIRKEPCHFCGSVDDLEMHHPDYSRPLRIYWLCRPCHRKLDGMLKGGRSRSVDSAAPVTTNFDLELK